MRENETEGRKRFHMNSFARRPILTVQKQKATRKWCTSTGVPMTNAKNILKILACGLSSMKLGLRARQNTAQLVNIYNRDITAQNI